jgi:hypothetical protein
MYQVYGGKPANFQSTFYEEFLEHFTGKLEFYMVCNIILIRIYLILGKRSGNFIKLPRRKIDSKFLLIYVC